jgi:thiosulfate dehydrogenase
MRFLKESWFPILLGVVTLVMLLVSTLPVGKLRIKGTNTTPTFSENEEWVAPSEDDIPPGTEGDMIRYGKDLIVNTAKYLGPKGIVGNMSNGMNCQNCHINAGKQNWANPFSAVESTYPKFRDRSGRVESSEFRVNECMQRSLNGKELDSLSAEMKAMVAYLKWIGEGVPKDIKPKGAGTEKLAFLDRAADPVHGKQVYEVRCVRCHGANGEGLPLADSSAYTYPPLWGEHSFNSSAGMYRLSNIAGFIKNNMPFQEATKANPVLTDEEAWDVSAYVVTQPHPHKSYPYDWPNIAKKPVDYPFGPYADKMSEQQHKYGPWK